jgi:hypothetical protein
MNQAQTDALLRRSNRGSRDALLQKTMDEPELGWRVLITLNAFRLLISTTLLLLFAIGSEPHFFGDARPTLFAACVAGYLVFAILSAGMPAEAFRVAWAACSSFSSARAAWSSR